MGILSFLSHRVNEGYPVAVISSKSGKLTKTILPGYLIKYKPDAAYFR